MTFKRNDTLYLEDILDATIKITQFVAGSSYAEFATDEKAQFAVVRAFEIIGEASKKLSPVIRERYSDLPWREISGMRDKLIHDYFGVDTEVIWRTIQEDIPVLNQKIRHIIDEIK